MSTPLNAACFSDPRWRLTARGFDAKAWLEEGGVKGTGGIVNPLPTSLRTGQNYFRFARSASPQHTHLGGGWWVDYETFLQIANFGKKHGYGLVEAARLHLALPYAWNGIDLLVKALLVEPLKAYTGSGKPAAGNVEHDKGTSWIAPKHVRQLFIPGLHDASQPDGPNQLYRRAFQPVSITRV